MKKYTIHVHYDVAAIVEVEAENKAEAYTLAKEKADEAKPEELHFCGVIDSCIADIKDC